MNENGEIRRTVLRCMDARETSKELEALGYSVRFEAHGRWISACGTWWDFSGIDIVVPDTGPHIVIDDIDDDELHGEMFRPTDNSSIEVIATPIEVPA